MRARINVTADAVTTSTLPDPVATTLHRSVLDAIRTHGHLVFGSQTEALELIAAVRSGAPMPPAARKLWEVTLVHLHKNRRVTVLPSTPPPVATSTSLTDLRTAWGPHTDVAMVSEHAGARLGIPSATGVLSDPAASPDVATLAAATECPRLRCHQHRASTAFAAVGSSRETFWSQVLGPLARDADSVTIVDRYLFKAVWANHLRPRRHAVHDHVCWMLERLDTAMAPDAEIRLLGAADSTYPGMDAAATAGHIHTQWQPRPTGRLKQVTVLLADSSRTHRFPHDRHIRFSNGAAIGIHAGLDRLRDTTLWDPDGTKWSYYAHEDTITALYNSERRAAANLRYPAATVLHR